MINSRTTSEHVSRCSCHVDWPVLESSRMQQFSSAVVEGSLFASKCDQVDSAVSCELFVEQLDDFSPRLEDR